jgi:hypothetical protein
MERCGSRQAHCSVQGLLTAAHFRSSTLCGSIRRPSAAATVQKSIGCGRRSRYKARPHEQMRRVRYGEWLSITRSPTPQTPASLSDAYNRRSPSERPEFLEKSCQSLKACERNSKDLCPNPPRHKVRSSYLSHDASNRKPDLGRHTEADPLPLHVSSMQSMQVGSLR